LNTVLVTGATGNIGRQLVQLLRETPDITTVPCFRRQPDAEKFTAMGLVPVHLDMDDPVSARAAVQGIDTLFLLKPYTIRMLIQSKIMLDAARAAGVTHVIHLGAHGADDTPWAPTGWNHMVERYIEALGFSWTHLRPNFFMDNLFRSVRPEDGVVTHFLGDLPISWISCRDIAAVAAAIALNPQEHRNRTYPLAVDRCSMPEIASLLSDLTGRQYRYERLPSATGFELMTKLGREPEFVRPWLDYMAAVADGRVTGVDEVIDNIQALTGQVPLKLREFISQNVQRFT
jgi:NAD(P)H dehydrogenase (quinone)